MCIWGKHRCPRPDLLEAVLSNDDFLFLVHMQQEVLMLLYKVEPVIHLHILEPTIIINQIVTLLSKIIYKVICQVTNKLSSKQTISYLSTYQPTLHIRIIYLPCQIIVPYNLLTYTLLVTLQQRYKHNGVLKMTAFVLLLGLILQWIQRELCELHNPQRQQHRHWIQPSKSHHFHSETSFTMFD
jgi:hypothetical protein